MNQSRAALGDLAEFINGVAFKPGDWSESGRRIIRIQNLNDQSKPFNRTFREVDQKYWVRNGDILVSWSASLGVFVWNQPDIALVNQHIFKVVPNERRVDKGYLRHMLSGALRDMEAHLHGATMQHVNRNEFLGTTVPLPPLPEQRRIAAILDLADTLRTKRKTALEFVTELERSSFDTAFGDPSSNRYGLPLGSIGDLVDSARYGTSQKSVPDGDVPVLRMGNLTMNGQIDMSDLKYMNLAPDEVDRYTVVSGDILFNRTNSAELVGKTAVYRGEQRVAYAGYLVRVRLKGDNEPAYVAGYLNSRHGKAVLRNMCKSIVGMANINAKELQRIPILLASPQSQLTYARAVDAIERQRQTLERDAQALNDLFSALQSRAFRGEL